MTVRKATAVTRDDALAAGRVRHRTHHLAERTVGADLELVDDSGGARLHVEEPAAGRRRRVDGAGVRCGLAEG